MEDDGGAPLMDGGKAVTVTGPDTGFDDDNGEESELGGGEVPLADAEGGKAVTVTGPDGPDGDGIDEPPLPELDGDGGSMVTVPGAGGDPDPEGSSAGGGGLMVNVGGRTVTVPSGDPDRASSEGKAVTVGGEAGGPSGVVPFP